MGLLALQPWLQVWGVCECVLPRRALQQRKTTATSFWGVGFGVENNAVQRTCDCHTCVNVRRTYPYLQPELWIADLEEERQRQRTHGPHEPYTYEL